MCKIYQIRQMPLVFFIIITLNIFVIYGNSDAQPKLRLIVHPPVETIRIGSDPQKITLIARVNQDGLQFKWQLEGPGQIKGDLASREIKYVAPDKIEGEEATATITATITDIKGEFVTDSVTFTLIPPPPVAVRIAFPAIFQQESIDLTEYISLNGRCEPIIFEPMLSIYKTTCYPENLPSIVSIKGFQDIPITTSPDNSGILTIDIQAAQMVAQFDVNVKEASDVHYAVGDQHFTPGQLSTLNIPLTRLQEPIDFIAYDAQQRRLPYKITFALHIEQALQIAIQNVPLELFTYKINTLICPAHWDPPEIQQDSETLMPLYKHISQGQTTWGYARPIDHDIITSWGPGWEDITLSAAELNTTREHRVTLDKFIPRLPLVENDPWLRENNIGDAELDPCEAPPVYSPQEIQLTYCKNTDECLPPVSVEIRRKEGNRYRVGNLGETGWLREVPLPNVASIRLQKMSHNPAYKMFLETPRWRLDQPLNPQTLQEMGVDPEEKFPIAFEGDVGYDFGIKLMLFDSLSDCENADITQHLFTPFMAALIENLRADICSCALLVKGDEKITECISGKRQGDDLIFTIGEKEEDIIDSPKSPDQFEQKRWIVVVENSKYLGESTEGRTIREALIEWLQDIKSGQVPISLNLFVVQSDGTIQEILRGEDLDTLAYSIPERIQTTLTFEHRFFNPLQNISLIHQRTFNKDTEKVLYFTDSRDFPALPEGDQLSPLYDWYREHVSVTIVTNTEHDCRKWGTTGVVECRALGDYHAKEDVRRILNEWQAITR